MCVGLAGILAAAPSGRRAQSRKSARERRSVWLRWNARTFVVAYACPSRVLPDERGGITTIKDLFTPIDFPGAPRTLATGINDQGQIVGAFENPAATPDRQRSPTQSPGMMSGP
jgi:hypothetical protein